MYIYKNFFRIIKLKIEKKIVVKKILGMRKCNCDEYILDDNNCLCYYKKTIFNSDINDVEIANNTNNELITNNNNFNTSYYIGLVQFYNFFVKIKKFFILNFMFLFTIFGIINIPFVFILSLFTSGHISYDSRDNNNNNNNKNKLNHNKYDDKNKNKKFFCLNGKSDSFIMYI